MADVLRLTYRELARRLGLTPDGARFLARRRMWPVEKGNDGRKLVMLTEAELATETERLADDPRMNGRSSPDDREVIGASMPADHIVADLRERLERAEGEAGQLRRQVADLRERAGKAEGEANALRDTTADLRLRLDRAEAQLADARTPWWRRLFGS